MENRLFAKERLQHEALACVIAKGDEVLYQSKARGIFPLYESVVLKNIEMKGAALADRVIGKAAAMFAVEAGIDSVFGLVMSEHAIAVLEKAGIPYEYQSFTPYIKNRELTGMCPVETRAIASDGFPMLRGKVERFLGSLGMIPETYLEETLVIIKPDAVAAGHVGEILTAYEQAGFEIRQMRMEIPSTPNLERHYAEHIGKSFFGDLIAFMSSGPAVFIRLSGVDVIARVRTLNGATDPAKALSTSLRGRFATDIQTNAVHGSESLEAAERELTIWFK